MDTIEVNCIYCGTIVDLRTGDGDHVLSAALGQFEGEFHFRRICPGCNSTLSKCEEQLLRCAPEAFLRRIVQPPVERNKRGNSWVGASHGMKPPTFTLDHGDHHELVHASPDAPRQISPIDQLVIVDKEKKEHHIRLFPGMTATALRAKIEASGACVTDELHLHVDAPMQKKYLALVTELRPDSPVVENAATEPGPQRVQVRAAFTFHDDYWRAIAKIGFHYYLLNSSRGVRGDEAEFADIRRFIIAGGDRTPFFTEPASRFALPFRELPDGSAVLPTTWAHILAADETERAATAMVSLFMGPERLAPTYHINLGRLQSSLVVPGARCAHAYLYRVDATESGIAGRVVPKSLSRL